MDTEEVVYICNGILLSHKKEWTNIYSNMDGPEIITLSELSREEKDKYHMIHWFVESKIWQKWTYQQNRNILTAVENRLMVAKKEGVLQRDGVRVWG